MRSIQCPHWENVTCYEHTFFAYKGGLKKFEEGIENGTIVVLTRPPTLKPCCKDCGRNCIHQERTDA